MKINNPDLSTSFYVTRKGKKFHILSLYIICHLNNNDGRISYHLYGFAYEDDMFHLGMCFDTPENAFEVADRICSAYPQIKSDLESSHLDEYPEFHEEKYKNE